MRSIREDDIDALRDAMSDWRADGVQMTEAQATATIKEWVWQMSSNQQEFFVASADASNPNAFVVDPEDLFERTWVYDGFYLNSSDECIGFQIGKFVGTQYQHRAAMMRPQYRSMGYYEEAAGIGPKTLFLTIKNCDSMTVTIPVVQSETMKQKLDSTVWVSEDLEVSSFTNVERIEPVAYVKKQVSKEKWLEWYNLPEQSEYRAQHYKYEILDH